MNHKMKFLGTTRQPNDFHNQIKHHNSPVPADHIRRLTIQGNTGVLDEKYSHIENCDGNRTELVVQGNVYWLKIKNSWTGR